MPKTQKKEKGKSGVVRLSAAVASSDSSILASFQTEETLSNDALLTSKWLERKKLEDLGIEYKKGVYTKEENEVLYAALNKYKISNGLTDDELYNLIYGTTPAEHKGFWREIATPLGTRPLKNVSIHVQRLFHHYNYTGKWTPDDDERLNQLITIHGKDWTTIGSELGRMGTQCRDRWRDYSSINKKKLRKGEWTIEEEDQLKLIITDIVTRYENEITLDYGIPWDIVSERMGNKRSARQCREKWGRKLRLKYEMEKGGEVSKWCSNDSYILVNKLYQSKQKEEYSFSWESLNDDEWGPWTQVYLHERWRRLKYTVEDFSSKNFSVIVRELYNRFQKSPPPSKYKSPEDSNEELEIVNE